MEAKHEATSIIEAITAEDIGKLPDLSIADSLARLPGVTAQRVRGRSQRIAIRGFGDDYSLSMLNGREQISAGNNRGIEFDQYPSELITKALVYKSPDATLAAFGIAGAVDLRTVRPLDYTERQINLSGKYVFNDNDASNPDFDDHGYRLFGSYIDQSDDGSFGWSLAATVQSNPTQYTSRELKTGPFQTSADPNNFGIVYPSDNPRTGVVSRDFERTSVAGTLQFEPASTGFQATIDAFYTDTEDAGIFRGVEAPIAGWSGAQFEGTTGRGTFADTATFSAVVPIVRTDEEGNTAEITSLGFNASYEFTDRLSVMADISTSTLERNDIDYESYAGTGAARSGAQDTLTYNMVGSGEYSIDHGLDYTDPSLVLLTDPCGWGQVGFIKRPKIDDELQQLHLEADYDLDNGFISGVKVGVLLPTREKNFHSNEAFLRAGPSFVNGSLAIPSGAIAGSTNSGGIGLDVIAYSTAALLNDRTYTVEKATFDTEWSVEEDITTLYAMADIDASLADIPDTGNFGFQFIDTEQNSSGTLNFGGNQTLQAVNETYDNFLPSLNLNFEVSEDTLVRLAAAKTLTRARLDQLAANQSLDTNNTICQDTNNDQLPDTLTGTITVASTCFSVNGGNPFLRPIEANSLDLTYEKYFGDVSAFSFAILHKDLSNWIVNRGVSIDGSQIITAGGLGAFLAANPSVSLTRLNGPDNFADGSITGYEATIRLGLDEYLPEAFAGFGVNASYSSSDGTIKNEGTSVDIPGYSEEVWS